MRSDTLNLRGADILVEGRKGWGGAGSEFKQTAVGSGQDLATIRIPRQRMDIGMESAAGPEKVPGISEGARRLVQTNSAKPKSLGVVWGDQQGFIVKRLGEIERTDPVDGNRICH